MVNTQPVKRNVPLYFTINLNALCLDSGPKDRGPGPREFLA